MNTGPQRILTATFGRWLRIPSPGNPGTEGQALGPWSVRADEGLVTDGRRTHRLEPRTMDVLSYLLHNRGRVVSRDELVREVWGGAAITDGAITRCIAAIRKALGDEARHPTYVVTIPKRGYRLNDDPSPPSPATLRGRLLFVGSAAAACLGVSLGIGLVIDLGSRSPSVEIRPFQDLDTGAATEGWGAGLTQDLLSELTPHSDLDVRWSDPAEASGELGAPDPAADLLVTGSIRREGDQARISCRVTSPSDRSRVRCADRCDLDTRAGGRLIAQKRVASELARTLEALADELR